MMTIKKLRGNGACTTKNMWRIHCGFQRHATMPDQDKYCEVGPGARRYVNLYNRFPVKFQDSAASQDASDVYSHLMSQLRSDLKRALRLVSKVRRPTQRSACAGTSLRTTLTPLKAANSGRARAGRLSTFG